MHRKETGVLDIIITQFVLLGTQSVLLGTQFVLLGTQSVLLGDQFVLLGTQLVLLGTQRHRWSQRSVRGSLGIFSGGSNSVDICIGAQTC